MTTSNIDPVIRTMKYAYTMEGLHRLKDMESAMYAAAFALYGEGNHLQIAKEAHYYHANTSGIGLAALREAELRRAESGFIGTAFVTS